MHVRDENNEESDEVQQEHTRRHHTLLWSSRVRGFKVFDAEIMIDRVETTNQ